MSLGEMNKPNGKMSTADYAVLIIGAAAFVWLVVSVIRMAAP